MSQLKTATLSTRLYALLLAAYPSEFRREYGREMSLVFADRCRDEAGEGGARALLRIWREVLVDLIRTAPGQHAERISEGVGLMKTLRTVVIALIAYALALLVVAPLYVRSAPSMPGFVNNLIDAVIATGVLFNVVYLVLTLPRFVEGVRAVRAALVVTALVIAGLVTVMLVSLGPPAHINASIVVAQVLSLLLWFSVHLWWVLRRKRVEPPAAVA